MWSILYPIYREIKRLLARFNLKPDSIFALSSAIRKLDKILKHKQLEIDQIPFTIAESIRDQEYIDSQTQLGNRRFFDARLDELLLTHVHSGGGVVILLSLTAFQTQNTDEFSEKEKAAVVQEVALLLQNIFTEVDGAVIARRSDYSFAILIYPLLQNQINKWITKIIQAFKLLNFPEASNLYHMGAASFMPGSQRYHLLSSADLALRTSELKGEGSYTVIADEGFSSRGMVQWRSLFENTLNHQRLTTYQQPVIDFSSDQIVHREILTRLIDEKNKEVFASEFIPMAFASGYLEPIERLIIDHVLKEFIFTQHKTENIALNISISTLTDHNFSDWLIKRLSTTNSLSEFISIEIREDRALLESEHINHLLKQLKSMGVKIGIDHVGEQLIPLDYLKNSLIDYVKIHQSVILQLTSDDSLSSELFIQSLAEIAQSNHFHLYAEGVENLLQLDRLGSLKVDAGQGFMLGTPEVF